MIKRDSYWINADLKIARDILALCRRQYKVYREFGLTDSMEEITISGKAFRKQVDDLERELLTCAA